MIKLHDKKDYEAMKYVVKHGVPEGKIAKVVYWKNNETSTFVFNKIRTNRNENESLYGEYIFERDVYSKVRVNADDIAHIFFCDEKSNKIEGRSDL